MTHVAIEVAVFHAKERIWNRYVSGIFRSYVSKLCIWIQKCWLLRCTI